MPVFLSTAATDFEARFAAMLSAKREDSADVGDAVAAIIADVRARGDAALVELTGRFDRLELTAEGLRFSAAEIEAAVAEARALLAVEGIDGVNVSGLASAAGTRAGAEIKAEGGRRIRQERQTL